MNLSSLCIKIHKHTFHQDATVDYIAEKMWLNIPIQISYMYFMLAQLFSNFIHI